MNFPCLYFLRENDLRISLLTADTRWDVMLGGGLEAATNLRSSCREWVINKRQCCSSSLAFASMNTNFIEGGKIKASSHR